jgi:hypothetical protein
MKKRKVKPRLSVTMHGNRQESIIDTEESDRIPEKHLTLNMMKSPNQQYSPL